MKYKRSFLISIVLLICVSEGNGKKCKVPQGPTCSRPQTSRPKLPYPQPPEPEPQAPEPQLPEHVTPDLLLPRQQRKKQCGMFPQKCPKLAKPRFAAMCCSESPSEKNCTATCIGRRVFRGTQVKKMTLTCRSFSFKPRNKFPDCVLPQGATRSRLIMPGPTLPYPQPPEPQPLPPQAPEPQLPEHVTPDLLLPRHQRKKQCGMFPQKCPTLAKPRFAAMRCWESPSVKKCIAKCIGHRVFRGTQLKKMTLTCRSFSFKPRNKFPDCIRQQNLKLLRPQSQAQNLSELVTPDPLLPRHQRKKQCGMFPQQCPTLAKPKFAVMHCRTSPNVKTCTAECVGHHVFRGTQLKKMTLTCTSYNFQPRKKFPDCIRNGKCRLRLVGPGKIKCRSNFNTIECQICCGGRNKGPFTCKKDGNWLPSLPRCVKQLGNPEFIQNLPRGYQTRDQRQWGIRHRDRLPKISRFMV